MLWIMKGWGKNDRKVRFREEERAFSPLFADNYMIRTDRRTVCCIYHKPRPVGESSSESESSDSGSSDADSDDETDHRQSRLNHSRHPPSQNGSSSNERPSEQVSERGSGACCTKHHGKQGKHRKPSPNAYEKMPKSAREHTKSQKP